MASGVGPEAVPAKKPFETALGHVEGSPFAKLKGEPGTVFNYSNAGVSHLVLAFHNATGTDLYAFLEEKLFEPVGIKQIRWQTHGGDGGIGPFSQGYSGIYTTPANTPGSLPARLAQGGVGRQADRPRELLRLRLDE